MLVCHGQYDYSEEETEAVDHVKSMYPICKRTLVDIFLY